MRPFHTIIVDKFFDSPYLVRKLALQQEYFTSEEGIYSGTRTKNLNNICKDLSFKTATRILNLYGENTCDYEWTSHFHLTGETFGKTGWVHSDSPTNLSAVIYLNPAVKGMKAGTSLYNYQPFYNEKLLNPNSLRQSFINSVDHVNDKEINNSNYIKTIEVGGIFNRLVVFDGSHPHAGMDYFGNNRQDSRLTMLFFIERKNKL